MAGEPTIDGSPSGSLVAHGVVPASLTFDPALCNSSGFSRWAHDPSPYWNLILACSALRTLPSPVTPTLDSPSDLKHEPEEGEVQDWEPIPPEVNMMSSFQVCLRLC